MAKQIKKIQSKKLEDRIAPGMVGGGMVDPGMVDVTETSTDQQADQSAGDLSAETSTEGVDQYSGEQGQYIDEAQTTSGEQTAASADGNMVEQNDSTDFNAQDDYNEFNKEGHDDMVEERGSWAEPDWVEANADGSVTITPPEGVTVDAAQGIASFPVEVANTELPIPENVQITPEGGLNVGLPEGTQFIAESNSLLMTGEAAAHIEDLPEGFSAVSNPDGSVMVSLPDDGVAYNAETNSLEMNNYYANEIAPEHIDIAENGTVNVNLPDEGVTYNADGSFTLTAEASHFMDDPPPAYVQDCECATYNPNGSVTFEPVEQVTVDGGIAEMSAETFNEEFNTHDEFQLNADGTSTISLPEGTSYNQDINGLTFAEGNINLNEVPEGIDAHVNPDGTTTVMLADGMQYNADTNSVHLDNYWTNAVTPDSMHVDETGAVSVAMPEGTEYYADGSLNIPAEQTDFIAQAAPEYVHDVDFAECHGDGSYTITPPENFVVNAETAQVTIPYESIQDHLPIDDHMEFHQDGTMSVIVPEGTAYNAATNTLTFGAGSVSMQELPEQINPTMNQDGSISVALQDGMQFNADTGSVQLDNYWTNELIPGPVEFTPEGNFNIQLPEGTEFHDDGSFSLAAHNADFMENPAPAYSYDNDFVNCNPDGSVSVQFNEGMQVNATEGTITMNTNYMMEHFDHQIPEGVHFNGDGTMNISVPTGTQYAPDANSLTFPAGSVHMGEIPPEVNAQLNPDGTITAQLQPGMEWIGETGQVHMNQYWTNELTPEPVEFHSDGSVQVNMPHDTHYCQDGSCYIPEGSADFMENPHPEYVEHGPEWVNDNPDGSVTVQAPATMMVDSAAGTVTMSYETAMAEFGSDLIPEDMTLNADGTADLRAPQEAQYDPAINGFRFEAGTAPLGDIPPEFRYDVDANGNVNVYLPEGMEYNAEANTIHISNAVLNQMAPAPITFTTDGQFQIKLPDDTQYFEGNSFVISAQSADFMDDGQHEGEQVNNYQTTQKVA